METILKTLQEFEKRNNISVTVIMHSDGSGIVEEFWDNEELKEFKDEKDLYEFLFTTRYKLADDGRCYSPVELLTPPLPDKGGVKMERKWHLNTGIRRQL